MQQMTVGLNCMVIIFNRKQSIFLKKLLPANRSVQEEVSVAMVQARQSHTNMMNALTLPLMRRRVVSNFCFSIMLFLLLDPSAGSCCSYQLYLSMLVVPMYISKRAMARSTPDSTIQSIIVQLYPRLKSVLTRELPSPSEMKNQSRKLATFSNDIAIDSRFKITSSFFHCSWQRRCSTFIAIQISRLRIVASMKNYQNSRQYSARKKV